MRVTARRIYRRGTSIQRHVYIRFVDNEALREFLQHSSQILVFGRYFRVRLLDKDKDPYHVRTGTLLPQDVTEEKLLHWRRQYFDDNTGIATVLVDNLPNVGPPYPIPGWARDGFKPYRFDWAYPWNINSPKKDDYEKNCFRAQDWLQSPSSLPYLFYSTASFDVGVGLTYGGLGRKVLLSIYSRGGYLGLRTRIMLGDLRGL